MGINKTPKGEIGIEDYRGRIRLRWRYAGERYSLNLPYAFLPEYMYHATIKVAEIKLDILKGCFDTNLEKYKAISAPPSLMPHQVVIQEPKEKTNKKDDIDILLKDLIPKFNIWATAIRNIDVENTTYYLSARNLLERWGDSFVDISLLNYQKKSMQQPPTTTG